eukprot:5813268-Prymnesium_polylepis.1
MQPKYLSGGRETGGGRQEVAAAAWVAMAGDVAVRRVLVGVGVVGSGVVVGGRDRSHRTTSNAKCALSKHITNEEEAVILEYEGKWAFLGQPTNFCEWTDASGDGLLAPQRTVHRNISAGATGGHGLFTHCSRTVHALFCERL